MTLTFTKIFAVPHSRADLIWSDVTFDAALFEISIGLLFYISFSASIKSLTKLLLKPF